MINEKINNNKSIIKHIHFTRISLVLLIIGVAIGIFVTAQWRTLPKRATDLVVSYSSLAQTKKKLVEENERLKQQINKLNEESTSAQNTLKLYTDLKNKVEIVQEDEKEIGLTEYIGEGVIVTLDDAKNSEANSQSITHAADLRDIINLLWGNGAKAIEINDERIVFNTSIDCIVNTILINSTKTTPPFLIKVIGDSEILLKSLNDGNKLSDIKKRVLTEGLIFEIEEKNEINLKPYDGSIQLEYVSINE